MPLTSDLVGLSVPSMTRNDMPAYAPKWNDEQIQAVVQYIKLFGK